MAPTTTITLFQLLGRWATVTIRATPNSTMNAATQISPASTVNARVRATIPM